MRPANCSHLYGKKGSYFDSKSISINPFKRFILTKPFMKASKLTGWVSPLRVPVRNQRRPVNTPASETEQRAQSMALPLVRKGVTFQDKGTTPLGARAGLQVSPDRLRSLADSIQPTGPWKLGLHRCDQQH